MKEKFDRNEKLYQLYKEHYPRWSITSIAKKFKLKRPTASLIIKKMKQQEADSISKAKETSSTDYRGSQIDCVGGHMGEVLFDISQEWANTESMNIGGF